MKGIRDKILKEYEKGNIVLMTFDGIKVGNFDEFIKLDGNIYK